MRTSFTSLRRADLGLLSRWLGAAHVEQWWSGPHDLVSIARKYGPLPDGVDPTRAFICHVDGHPIGFVQAYHLADEPAWRATITAAIGNVEAAGIDCFIGEVEFVGRGLGSQMIGDFVATVWDMYGESSCIVVAVQQGNAASWRALERATFARRWAGHLDSDDPSDQGPAFVHVLERPRP